jgi:hypothetical protein
MLATGDGARPMPNLCSRYRGTVSSAPGRFTLGETTRQCGRFREEKFGLITGKTPDANLVYCVTECPRRNPVQYVTVHAVCCVIQRTLPRLMYCDTKCTLSNLVI